MKRTPNSLITSAELASASEVTLSTIHYYTTLGLLRACGRSGNKRQYERREARSRRQEIQRSRQEGYSLAMIRQRLVGV